MKRKSTTTLTRYEVGSSSKKQKQREEIKHIPGEIIEQILIRLPVKSIIRSQLISKFWYTVISDPFFAQTHLNAVTKNHYLNLVESRSSNQISIYEKELFKCVLWTPIPLNYPRNGLVGSCNGLVCMHEAERIVVFNPVTRESVYLPNPVSTGESFDMELSIFKWSFGFNPNSNEYKIIRFYGGDRDQKEWGVQVFTLGKDVSSWRQIEGGAPGVLLSRAINIGAAMYSEIHYHDDSIVSVLFFDLSEEKFGRIEPPKGEYYKSVIMDLDCRLCWVSLNSPGQNRIMKLWILDKEPQKNKSNWTHLRSIQLSVFIRDDFCSNLLLQSKARNKLQLLKLERRMMTCSYYLDFTMKNGSVEYVVFELGPYRDLRDIFCTACDYVESLLTLPQMSM